MEEEEQACKVVVVVVDEFKVVKSSHQGSVVVMGKAGYDSDS